MNIGSRLIRRQIFLLLVLLSGFSIHTAYGDQSQSFHQIDLQHLRAILSKAKIIEVSADREKDAKKADQWCTQQVDALRNPRIQMRIPKPIMVFSGPEALDRLAKYRTNGSTLGKLCPGKFTEFDKLVPTFSEIYRLPGQPKHNPIIFQQSVGTIQGYPRTSGWYEVDAKRHRCTASFGFEIADYHPSDPPGTPTQEDSMRELVDLYEYGHEVFFYNAMMDKDEYSSKQGTLLLYQPQYFFTPRRYAQADPDIANATHQPDASYVCRIQFTF